MKRPKHLSVSKVKTYRTCGRKYYYKYYTDLPTRRGVPLIIGTATDEALQLGITQLRTMKEVDLKLIYQSFEENIAAEIESANLSQEELIELAQGTGNIRRAFEPYFEYIFNRFVEFLKPQLEVKDWYPDEDLTMPITGFIDLVAIDKEGDYVIIDHKAKGKCQVDPEDKFQVLTYGIWLCENYGLDVIPKSEIHIFLKNSPKKTPEKVFHIEEVYFSQAQVDNVRKDFLQLQEAIDKQYFPANRWHYLCNRKWCDYYDVCSTEG